MRTFSLFFFWVTILCIVQSPHTCNLFWLQEVSKKKNLQKNGADGKCLISILSLPFLCVDQVTSKMADLGMHVCA